MIADINSLEYQFERHAGICYCSRYWLCSRLCCVRRQGPGYTPSLSGVAIYCRLVRSRKAKEGMCCGFHSNFFNNSEFLLLSSSSSARTFSMSFTCSTCTSGLSCPAVGLPFGAFNLIFLTEKTSPVSLESIYYCLFYNCWRAATTVRFICCRWVQAVCATTSSWRLACPSSRPTDSVS